MPQLDPSPWLMIFMFTWITFLTVIPAKVMAHSFPNTPISQNASTPKTIAWNWQWH